MKKQLSITAILAIAGLSLAASSAKAQVSPALSGSQSIPYNDGDLLLGFVQYNVNGPNTETSTDYILDLGAASQYEAGGAFYQPGVSVNLNLGGNADLGNVNADLVGAFGTNWATNPVGSAPGATYFSVVGYLANSLDGNGTDPTAKLWTTNPTTTPYAQSSISSQQSTGSGITTIESTHGGDTSTGNSDVGEIIAGNNSSNYNFYEPGGSFPSQSTSFGTNWSGPSGNEVPVGTVLYLDAISPNPGGASTILGTFTVLSTGEVDYQAIPEPSTYASLGLGVMLLVVWRMKRRNTMLPA